MRLDKQTAAIEDFQATIRARDWYRDLSEQESDEESRHSVSRAEGQEANVENQPGVENRPLGRRRARNHAPQRRTQRVNPRTPHVLQPLNETTETTVSGNSIQQGMQRLYVLQQQCVDQVGQVDNRLEQFRQAIRQDAFELALTAQRVRQDLQGQGQGVEQIRHTLYDIVQDKVETLESRFQKFDEFAQSVMSTTDKSTHEVCSSVAKIMDEQAEIRRLVEELARRMDHAQEGTAKIARRVSSFCRISSIAIR